MCNELLRKLSKAHNTEFCGRVLSFLSYVFPLTERSAINVAGKYNEANITEFEEEEEFMAAEGAVFVNVKRREMNYITWPLVPLAADPDLSEKMNETALDKGKDDDAPVDYRLYKTLWGLQQYLSQPKLGVSSMAEWKQLVKNIGTVLTAFEGCSFSNEDLTRARDRRRHAAANQGSAEKAKVVDSSDAGHFFQPKYLSASRLLRLQRKDPEFRQQVLSQLLILFGYFEGVQCKLPARCDLKELAEPKKRIFELMAKTPPDGAQFVKAASHIMAREGNWKKWKAGKCQNFVRAPTKSDVKAETVQEKRKRLMSASSSLGSAKRSKTGGVSELAKVLKNVSDQDNFTCLSSAEFVYTPKLDAYLETFEEANDPDNEIDDEFHPKHNKMYCWRLRRLMSTCNVELLGHMQNGGNVEKAVLEYCKSQGRGPKEEEKEEEKKEEEQKEEKKEEKKEEAAAPPAPAATKSE
jgi:THO complex subunit 1